MPAEQVSRAHTFKVRDSFGGLITDKIVTLQPGADVTLACDFTDVLNPGQGISSVTSVTDEASQSPAITISGAAVSDDARKVHWDVTNITDALEYRLEVIAVTTDSQTLVVDCRVDGEATP